MYEGQGARRDYTRRGDPARISVRGRAGTRPLRMDEPQAVSTRTSDYTGTTRPKCSWGSFLKIEQNESFCFHNIVEKAGTKENLDNHHKIFAGEKVKHIRGEGTIFSRHQTESKGSANVQLMIPSGPIQVRGT